MAYGIPSAASAPAYTRSVSPGPSSSTISTDGAAEPAHPEVFWTLLSSTASSTLPAGSTTVNRSYPPSWPGSNVKLNGALLKAGIATCPAATTGPDGEPRRTSTPTAAASVLPLLKTSAENGLSCPVTTGTWPDPAAVAGRAKPGDTSVDPARFRMSTVSVAGPPASVPCERPS